MDGYEFQKKFHSVMHRKSDFYLCIAKRNATPIPPRHQFSTTSVKIKTALRDAQYVVKFFPDKDVFIVWDNKRHRALFGAGYYTFGLGKDWDDATTGPTAFYAQYKELGRHNSGLWEKIYVVGVENFDMFFQRCDAYMQFNALDDNFPSNDPKAKADEEAAHWKTTTERRKYSSLQYQRDQEFRKEVLGAYSHECAICRCNIEKLLEAAHERGFEVSCTLYDDPKHGICLCANHHLMYDRKLIDIDLDTLEIKVIDERVKQMPWYREFTELHKGKIAKRNV